MVDFFVKSILSLGILYVFYLLFLSLLKTFHFNRYFLLGSLVFSLIIPFIDISEETNIAPLVGTDNEVSIAKTIEYTSDVMYSISKNALTSNSNFLYYIYGSICLILLVRFFVNFISIIKKIVVNQKERKNGYTLVYLNESVLPFTFFRFIFVNRKYYEIGKVDISLIQHEFAHCKQLHSLDIILIELVKVFVWFNPFMWLVKRQIQLNHEYLADNSVLRIYELKGYQKTLLDVVFASNKELLVSNFNYSFTKQRLKMMIKPFYSKKAMALNIVAFAVIFLVGYTFANFQVVSDGEKNNSEVIVNTDKFDYLIGMEYDDKNGLEGLTRQTRGWRTYKNGEMIGRTNFASNGYRIVTSERITIKEATNTKNYKIYDVLVLSDNYKTCTGCFQSKNNKDRILSIHPVSGVTKDTIHAAFKIDKETLKYQPVDYSNYEWVHERSPWKEMEEMKERFEDKKK
jgi:hypothetical protein